MIPDMVLIQRFLAGDNTAFDELWGRHYETVWGQLTRFHLTDPDLEELMQLVAIRLLLKLKSFRGESKFSCWLYRVAYNEALMWFRKGNKYRQTTVEIKEDHWVDYGVFEETERREILRKTLRRINAMPAPQQQTVRMMVECEKNLPAAMKRQGKSYSGAKTKINRLRALLSQSREVWVDAA